MQEIYDSSKENDLITFQGLSNTTICKFSKICRTCLVEGENISIYGVTYEEQSVYDLLQLCTSVQVQPDDDLPQNMCHICINDLFQVYSFIKKCQQSDIKLHYLLASKHFLDNDHLQETKTQVNQQTLNQHSISETNLQTNEQKVAVLKNRKCKKKLKSYECSNCKEIFTNYVSLKTHQKLMGHAAVRKQACTVCAKSFTSSKLRQHMRAHTKEKPFKCKICLQGFSMSGNLKRHMMTHTGERPHVCEICGKGFIQSTTLQNHKRTHTKDERLGNDINSPHYVCSYCGRGFKRLARYNAHLNKHLSKTVDVKKTVVDDRKHECSTCQRSYKTKHLLKAHQLTHGEKSFLCNECGKGFITKAALQSHLKVHTGEKPHNCNICNKSFAHIGSFEAHMLIHTGIKPYDCNICKKAFTQLSHLKYHMRTHSGERPYMCSYCAKTFALKGNLTVHIRTHTGETPYLCPICGKGFYDSSSMKKHKRGHGNELSNNSHLQLMPVNNECVGMVNSVTCVNSSIIV